MKAVNACGMHDILEVARSPLGVATEPIILMTETHSRYRPALFAVKKRVKHVR